MGVGCLLEEGLGFDWFDRHMTGGSAGGTSKRGFNGEVEPTSPGWVCLRLESRQWTILCKCGGARAACERVNRDPISNLTARHPQSAQPTQIPLTADPPCPRARPPSNPAPAHPPSQDAMGVARNILLDPRLVPGGGAVEMAVSRALAGGCGWVCGCS